MASSKDQEKANPAAESKSDGDQKHQQQQEEKKPAAALGEDDEFEDFPVEDWDEGETEAAAGRSGTTKHLWEESWDDDDTSDDFSTQLKEELQKVEASKRR